MMQTLSTVLVVDDSSFMRTLIAEMVESTREFQVVGTAADGIEAIEAIRSLNPDIVTLDIEMPRLDGLQTLDTIMRELPRPVVMLSAAGSERGNEMTLRALERGAVEFVRKPSGPISIDLLTVRQELLAALNAARATVAETTALPVPMQLRNAPTKPMKEWGYGAEYQHAHQFEDAMNTMECLPDNLRGAEFYQPTERGVEKRIAERLAEIRARRKAGLAGSS